MFGRAVSLQNNKRNGGGWMWFMVVERWCCGGFFLNQEGEVDRGGRAGEFE